MNQRFDNMDANESVWTERALKFVRTKVLEIRYATLKWRDLIPLATDIPKWATSWDYQVLDRVGVAKWIHTYSDELARADVKGTVYTARVKDFGNAYGYSIGEIQKAMAGSGDLPQRKANTARQAQEEFLDSKMRLGDSDYSILGLLNNPNVPVSTLLGALEGDAPDDVVKAFSDEVGDMIADTNGVERPTDLVVDIRLYNYMASTRMGDGMSQTILEQVEKVCKLRVTDWYALTGAGAAGKNRALLYRKSPDVLEAIVPRDFEQLPPQPRNLEVVTPCWASTGGVVFYLPLAARYIDYPAAV